MIIRKKKNTGQLRTINFDSYGNAIPNVPSIQEAGSSIAATIVETREVMIKPRKKVKPLAKPSKGLLSKIIPWSTKPNTTNLPAVQSKDNTQLQYIPKQELQPHASHISEFIELSFKRLTDEFNSREKQLEQRFHALEQHNKIAIASKRRWIIPAAILGSIAGGYMLYVLTNMQDSMTLMATNIPQMNQHMGAMAGDTQIMSGNMQNMNQSMGDLNGNVAYMNQQMGSISNSIEPIGDAAATAQPFMGMMRSFMPF
ncbi:MAG: hypothetical protein V3U78_02270 [Thiotrichaceae bacterium]